MIAVTTEDVERVEAEAEQARRDLREAEREYASNRTSTHAYERHQDAIGRADHAAVRARVLREEWAEQQAVRDRRAAEGETAAREMAGTVEGLVSSRERAVEAVVEAVGAMGRALAALEAHDRLVRAAGAELGRRGLRSLDGEPTGASLDGSARIAGVEWPLVDGGSVLGRCLVDVVGGQYGRHPMARMVWPPYGGATAGKGRDEVLALVHGRKGR